MSDRAASVELSAVVPCFNEEESVALIEAALIPALERLGVSYEILAVDDGSADRTVERLNAAKARGAPLRVLRHGVNRGLGAAIRTAIGEARGAWIAVLDADMTFAPEQLAGLWKEQKETGADCVIGSPILGRYAGVSAARSLPSRALNRAYRMLFGGGLTAFTPMFRLYRASSVKDLPARCDGFEISVELAVLLLRRGAKVVEIPAVLTARAAGASKLRRFRELARHARLVARLLFA